MDKNCYNCDLFKFECCYCDCEIFEIIYNHKPPYSINPIFHANCKYHRFKDNNELKEEDDDVSNMSAM